MVLPVPFARGEHDGSSLLQHRDEVGGDDGLREEILTGAEEGRPLPAPHMVLQTVVPSVTRPDGEMAVLQAARDFIGYGGVAHPRTACVVDVAPETIGILVFLQTGRHQLTDVPATCLHHETVVFVGRGDNLLNSVVDVVCGFRCEKLFSEVGVSADLDSLGSIIDIDALQS